MMDTNNALNKNDDDFLDEEEEEENAQDFDIRNINKRRCARCNHSPLLPYVHEGFNVWFCTQCKLPVCTACLYPALEHADAAPGLICRKCRKVYMP